MGEIIEKKSFVVNEDGTIIRNKKCPKCGRNLLSEGEYCEYCGEHLHSSKKRNSKRITLVTVLVLCFLSMGGVIVYQHHQCSWYESEYGYALDRLSAYDLDSDQVFKNGGGDGENDITTIVQQRDELLLEVNELKEKTRNLQSRVNELEEENGYLTTDVRLATEALQDCIGR